MMHKCYDWIVGCIYSCETGFQLQCCGKLIELFEKQFEGEIGYQSLATDLMMDLQNQETTIFIEV